MITNATILTKRDCIFCYQCHTHFLVIDAMSGYPSTTDGESATQRCFTAVIEPLKNGKLSLNRIIYGLGLATGMITISIMNSLIV
jgi:hypothetical protein